MEYRKFGENHYVVRIDRGEEVVSSLYHLCKEEKITAGEVVGLGAADHVSVGLYNVAEQKYHAKSFDGEMEITSLIGNISVMNGAPYLHIHINVCDPDMNIHGGHLTECRISATSELMVTVLDGTVGRKQDSVTGLNIYDFS